MCAPTRAQRRRRTIIAEVEQDSQDVELDVAALVLEQHDEATEDVAH